MVFKKMGGEKKWDVFQKKMGSYAYIIIKFVNLMKFYGIL